MRPQRQPLILLLAAAILLGACGTPTPYQPATDGYGYREQQIAENRYRIIVTGNRLTPRSRVEDYVLFRAAELTRSATATRFTVVTRDVERSTTYWTTHTDPFFHHGLYCDACGDRYRSGFNGTTFQPQDRYRASAEIFVHAGDTAPDGPNTYDAAEILKRLRPRVHDARVQ